VLLVRATEPHPFRSIAACIDFSETSGRALEQAIRVAALDGAALHILHVFQDPWDGVRSRERLAARVPDFATRYRHGIEKALRAFCAPFAHEIGALKATYHALQSEGHGAGIVQFVTRERCDLVVLGTRAKWNLRDFVWGSTAERVVRDAPCSALTVRPSEPATN
jgi:nucleotide-binding universal stress UspA family protein